MVTIAYDLRYPTPYHWDIFGHILLLHTCWQSVQGHFVVVVVFLCLLLLWDWSSGTGIQVFILSSFRSIKAFMILFLVPPYAPEDDVPFFSCSKDLPPETMCFRF